MAQNQKSNPSRRIGIFGGTFNPLHNGHINSVNTVLRQLKLDEIRVIPAYMSPGRTPVEGASPAQRLEMVQQHFAGKDKIVVDDREIRRGGVSYTVDTVNSLREEFPGAELYLIIGIDQFESFAEWKNYESLLEQVNLVVTSRPNAGLPQSEGEFPLEIGDLVVDFDTAKGEAILETDRKVIFIQLDNVDVSSTDIRRRILAGETVEGMVPGGVIKYIQEWQLYQGLGKRIGDFEGFTRFCAERLFDRKAFNVQGYDVREINQPSEYVLIASGTSTRHAITMSEYLVREVKTHYGVFPQSTEGQREGRWVVLDYGLLIVHIFYDFTRNEYRLEELWKEGVDLGLKDNTATPKET